MTVRPSDPPATTATASMTVRAVTTSGDSDGSDATRITLVHDHSIVREGMRRLLETTSDIRVVAEAGSVADAIQIARTVDSDVIVMDVRLVDGSGVVASRVIARLTNRRSPGASIRRSRPSPPRSRRVLSSEAGVRAELAAIIAARLPRPQPDRAPAHRGGRVTHL